MNTTLLQYHDGKVSCKVIHDGKSNKAYFVTGQIARDVKTGRFVSFKNVFC